MKYTYYEITEADVAKALFQTLTARDVGKRVYLSDGNVRIESDEELASRHARIAADAALGIRQPAPDAADKAMKAQAARMILNVLRSPIALMTRPTREEALELAERFEVTAADLIELAVGHARNT